jgi:2-iminobutanoate/2-iminopropanoate deaminase
MNDIIRFPSPLSAPISKAVRAGDFLFLSGQTPKNADLTPMRGDIKAQTQNVLEAIKSSLAEHGVGLDRVIRATVWLSDINMMGAFNEAYRPYFAGALPVRSTVEAKLSQGVDVEIEVTAWAPKDAGHE